MHRILEVLIESDLQLRLPFSVRRVGEMAINPCCSLGRNTDKGCLAFLIAPEPPRLCDGSS
jgi:hypothetical protein